MKTEGFASTAAVSALLSAYYLFQGAASVQFALFLLALPMAGFFALAELKKGGVPSPRAEVLYAAAVLAGYFVALVFASALFKPAFLPALLALCVPSATSAVSHYISG